MEVIKKDMFIIHVIEETSLYRAEWNKKIYEPELKVWDKSFVIVVDIYNNGLIISKS